MSSIVEHTDQQSATILSSSFRAGRTEPIRGLILSGEHATDETSSHVLTNGFFLHPVILLHTFYVFHTGMPQGTKRKI
ncbi:hypothetical protein V1477_006123, partial [Vespula maculifrons]